MPKAQFINPADLRKSTTLKLGSIPVNVYDKTMTDELSRFSSIGYSEWMGRIKKVRGLIATLINSRSEEVAFVGNTSEGLSMVASGFKWNEGDTILISKPDFPSNIYPWLNLERSGVTVKFVERRKGKLKAEDFSKVMDKRTRMIAVSSVDFLTGFCIDLEEMGTENAVGIRMLNPHKPLGILWRDSL